MGNNQLYWYQREKRVPTRELMSPRRVTQDLSPRLCPVCKRLLVTAKFGEGLTENASTRWEDEQLEPALVRLTAKLSTRFCPARMKDYRRRNQPMGQAD